MSNSRNIETFALVHADNRRTSTKEMEMAVIEQGDKVWVHSEEKWGTAYEIGPSYRSSRLGRLTYMVLVHFEDELSLVSYEAHELWKPAGWHEALSAQGDGDE